MIGPLAPITAWQGSKLVLKMASSIQNKCLKYQEEEQIPKEFETKEESLCIRQLPSLRTVTHKLSLVQILWFLNSIYEK